MEEKILTAGHVYDIFCNVDELMACNAPLAQALDNLQQAAAGRPVTRLGEAFKTAFSLLNLEAYGKFCANQKPACELYHSLLEVGERS